VTATATKRALHPDDPRTRWPIFSFGDAAKFLGGSERTLRDWAHPRGDREPVITSFETRGRQPVLPFIGFAEAYVLLSLRKVGLPLQRIRPAVRELKSTIGLDHALASRNLYTDGAEVLYHYADDENDLTVVRSGQRLFRQMIESYLKRIHYGADGWADRLELPDYGHATVIVDPRMAFGRPLVQSGGARVQDIVDRFNAGESIDSLAEDFRVPAEDIEDVLRVETRSAGRTAA